jgi:radical SAM superfamily enzyme YgiQ (UPF0313 family)
MANLKGLKESAEILEFTIQKDPRDIAEALLQRRPRLIGIGVYIWNAQETYELVSLLKKISPETVLVLGGPEVSYEAETNPICQVADFTIQGEADFQFYEFCYNYLINGQLPQNKIIRAVLPEISRIAMPYSFYSDEDIRNRVIYVEVSRGCPYRCEYCLSSLDKSVRGFEVDTFIAEMEQLLNRGVRQFKFIDRTFNLSPSVCDKILKFFLSKIELGLFLHFEMVPDRLPQELRELIKQFPAGALQFEIGIQTWNTEVAKNVSRRNDYKKVEENFNFLATETGVHTHADLIVGLPGETLQSFAEGFDKLAKLRPNEIQVGILKRLKGAPISRHSQEFLMVYSDHPPFQILRNRDLSYAQLQIMNRFAKFWDLYANSGSFPNFVQALQDMSLKHTTGSFFWQFYDFNTYLSERYSQSYGISQLSLFESAFEYLTTACSWTKGQAQDLLVQDYALTGRIDKPKFFREKSARNPSLAEVQKNSIPKRQQRHLQQGQSDKVESAT